MQIHRPSALVLSWFNGLQAVGATIAAVWITMPRMVQSLIILMALDFLLGIICSIQRQERAFTFKNWTQKVAVLLIIGAAYLIMGGVGQGAEIAPGAIAGGYCVWLGRSILKKSATLGIPVPRPVQVALSITEDPPTPTEAERQELHRRQLRRTVDLMEYRRWTPVHRQPQDPSRTVRPRDVRPDLPSTGLPSTGLADDYPDHGTEEDSIDE